MAFKPLQRPASITTLLDSGISLYKTVLRQVLVLSAAIAILSLLPELLFPTNYVEVEGGQRIAETNSSALRSLLGMVVMAGSVLLSTAMVFMVYQASENQDGAYNKAWQMVSKNWLSIILTVFFYSAMVVLGAVMFIIPAIYVYITFMFAVFFAVLEDDGPFAALKKSFYLMQGNWLHSFGLMLLVAMFILFVAFIFFSAFSVGMQPGELYDEQIPFGLYVMVAILVAFATPLMTAMQVVLYRDLHLRNSQFSIDELQ